MADEPESVLLVLFATPDQAEFQDAVHKALAAFPKPHQLHVFNPFESPEVADYYRVLATPTLIFEGTDKQSFFMIGECSEETVTGFLREPHTGVCGAYAAGRRRPRKL